MEPFLRPRFLVEHYETTHNIFSSESTCAENCTVCYTRIWCYTFFLTGEYDCYLCLCFITFVVYNVLDQVNIWVVFQFLKTAALLLSIYVIPHFYFMIFSERDALPSHFLLKIVSFSILSKASITKYCSSKFEAGGYKWCVLFNLHCRIP